MTSVFVTVLLGFLTELSNLTTDTSTIGRIIKQLIGIIPWLEQEFASVVPAVNGVIAALQSNPATTPQQMAVLQALDAQDDAAFEAAVTAYNAANPTTPLPLAGTPLPPTAA